MTIRPLIVLTALAVALTAAPARAGVEHISVKFDGSPADIVVYNNGNQFTHITQSTLDYVVSQDIDCGNREKVARAVLAAGYGVINTSGGSLGGEPLAWDWTHEGAKRAVRFEVDLARYFAPHSGQQNPVQVCNRKLDQLVAQGQLRHRLLEQGFVVPTPHNVSIAARCVHKNAIVEGHFNGPWPQGGSGWHNATDQTIGAIRCKGKRPSITTQLPPRPTSPNTLAVPFQVSSVRLKAKPKVQTVECPAKVRFEAEIEAVGDGTVRYRGNVNGGLGPIKTVRFRKGGKRKIPMEIEVGGRSAPTWSTTGSGVGVASTMAPQGPQPDTIEGWARIEILSPEAGVDRSKKTRYTVHCKPPLLIPAVPYEPGASQDDTKPCDAKPCDNKPDGDRGRGRRR